MLIPCVICGLGLGIDASEDGECVVKPQEYEPGDEMREHLVEQHSKYVARALLNPNPEDKVHFWLLANVNSANKTTVNGFKSDQRQNCGITTGDDGNDAATPMVDEALASAFLSSLEQFLSAGQTVGASNGVSTVLSNPAPLVDNLVESKALRKAFCQVCKLSICSTARQRHVYMIHMNRKDIFQCAKCDYTNNNSSWEMRKHCSSHHGADGDPIEEMIINNEGRYADEIQMWNRLCFPEWKQKQQTAVSSQMEKVPESPYTPDDAPNDEEMLKSCVETFIQKLQSVQAAEQEDISQLSEEHNSTDIRNDEVVSIDATKTKKSSGSALTESDWLCHLCWEESRYPGRHIAQKHLGKPLYECPLCEEFAGSYESCTVMKHIRKMHPEAFDSAQEGDASQIAPISNLERYAEEIRELQAQCFPNRPMKLARSTANSRPRERHLCRLCDTQVAQSDRQRHVYHKHLRKEKVFQCPLCEFHSNYDIHRVKWHLKWIHKEESENVEPISLEAKYREDIDALNEQCFPDWLHRRRPIVQTEGEPVKGTTTVKEESVEDGEIHHPSPLPLREATSSNGEPSAKKLKLTMTGTGGDDLTCQLCFKEFKPSSNFLRHVAKEHLKIFLYKCPLCDTHGGQDAYDVRAHMLRAHGHKESSGKEPISNFETNYDEIALVYKQCFPSRKLKSISASLSNRNSVSPTPAISTLAATSTRQKVDEISESKLQLDDQKVACKECQMEMKSEDRQIHVYRHHLKEPRLYECPLCDFTHHACSSDVRNHIRMQHRDKPDAMPRANLLEFSEAIGEWNDRCFPGWINRRLPTSVLEDFNRCRLCDVEVRQLSRHIAEVHLMIPLHKCPLCEYGAAEARLVNRHMKNNHKKKEIKGLEPISNVLLHRTAFSDLHDQCFPGRPKRLSNISISDEGKRMKCKRCTMTISKKRRLLHLLEKHLQKPVYRCKLCQFSSNFNKQAVELHLKEKHQREEAKLVLSSLDKYIPDLRKLARVCFNDSEIAELYTKCR